MAYTDYKFYTKKFFGKTIPESEFREYAERASDCVDNYTMDRLVDGLPENERAEIKVQNPDSTVPVSSPAGVAENEIPAFPVLFLSSLFLRLFPFHTS